MNSPNHDRPALLEHVRAVENRFPIRIVGLLPRGSVGHVFDENALDFLAEKKPGLSLLGLSGAESDLAERIGRPVGIVLVSGLRDRETEEFPKIAKPI